MDIYCPRQPTSKHNHLIPIGQKTHFFLMLLKEKSELQLRDEHHCYLSGMSSTIFRSKSVSLWACEGSVLELAMRVFLMSSYAFRFMRIDKRIFAWNRILYAAYVDICICQKNAYMRFMLYAVRSFWSKNTIFSIIYLTWILSCCHKGCTFLATA